MTAPAGAATLTPFPAHAGWPLPSRRAPPARRPAVSARPLSACRTGRGGCPPTAPLPSMEPCRSSRRRAGCSESLAHVEHVGRRQLQPLRDAMAVPPLAAEDAQNQEIEGAPAADPEERHWSTDAPIERRRKSRRHRRSCQLPSLHDGRGRVRRQFAPPARLKPVTADARGCHVSASAPRPASSDATSPGSAADTCRRNDSASRRRAQRQRSHRPERRTVAGTPGPCPDRRRKMGTRERGTAPARLRCTMYSHGQ